jgi:outer membrane protein OmpA-like peptidoglycan-associated protein
MKKLFAMLLMCLPMFALAQEVEEDEDDVETAEIEVTITDFKRKASPYEIVVFRSLNEGKEYQGISDEKGKFSLELPVGDKYEIFILGFKDSTSYNILEIPPLAPNAYYKDPFKVDIKFEPSRTFVLEDCNFEFGKAVIDTASYPIINELIEYMRRKPDIRIELGGHTDNVGSAAANLKLSQERADAVKEYMVAHGIDESRIESKGYGMTQPIESNKTEAGRAMNRRTEVKIID